MSQNLPDKPETRIKAFVSHKKPIIPHVQLSGGLQGPIASGMGMARTAADKMAPSGRTLERKYVKNIHNEYSGLR